MTMTDEAAFISFQKGMEALGAKHEVRWVLDEMLRLGRGDAYLQEVLQRRSKGEPLAYIFGHWAFRSHEFHVGPGVLIPRPETEELVDLVLERMRSRNKTFPSWHIVDAGAGSGCLGIALQLEAGDPRTQLDPKLTLIELSEEAWPCLEKNIAQHVPTANLFKGSWLEWPPERIQVLVSNPPYISGVGADKPDESVAEWEPHSALFPEDLWRFPDASGPYRELIRLAQHCVEPGGIAAFELGAPQASWISEHLKQNYPLWSGELVSDMGGKARFWIMQRLA
jgi:release factor glutamine methyltransferase